MSLSVNIEKRLGNFQLKVKFEADDNVLSILGASGCGKSMTLKCIAGIEKPDKGSIVMDGVTLFDSEQKINLPPQKRKVGYLFQQYALFPNMTVEQNICCGVRDKEKRTELVSHMIQSMGLAGLEHKRPNQLSGGQQQRVALARILVNEPEVLLLDEPFSALDSHLRFQLEREVHEIMKQFGKTVILVSHDRDEVFRLSDSIAIMQNGKIEAVGEKKDVFKHPRTKNGAILTGCKNISEAEIVDDTHVFAKDWNMKLQVPEVTEGVKYVGIRMHDIKLQGVCKENLLSCEVKHVIENPFSYTVMVGLEGVNTEKYIGVEMKKHLWDSMDQQRFDIYIPPDAILLLEE